MALKPVDSKVDIVKSGLPARDSRPFSEPPPYPGNRAGSYAHLPPNSAIAGMNAAPNPDALKRLPNSAQQQTNAPPYYPSTNANVRKPYVPLGEVRRPPSTVSSSNLPPLTSQQWAAPPKLPETDDDKEVMWKSEDELVSLGASVLAKRLVEAHSRLGALSSELKAVKSSYQRLQEDNQELRDLCCFLDDDRQKGRKLAREWQRFGRYTASVMRQEVANYQTKLRQLETRQQELVKDNIDLKELCLYLDEERFETQRAPCSSCGAAPSPLPSEPTLLPSSQPVRDDGDGSSSSTNADEPRLYTSSRLIRSSQSGSQERLLDDRQQRSQLSEQLLRYTRSLEMRISQLEAERNSGQRGAATAEVIASRSRPLQPPPYSAAHHQRAVELGIRSEDTNSVNSLGEETGDGLANSRPEAVTRALRVLQIRESMEPAVPSTINGRRSRGVTTPSSELEEEVDCFSNPDALGDGERAIVHAMCNVVWRKLEEAPSL